MAFEVLDALSSDQYILLTEDVSEQAGAHQLNRSPKPGQVYGTGSVADTESVNIPGIVKSGIYLVTFSDNGTNANKAPDVCMYGVDEDGDLLLGNVIFPASATYTWAVDGTVVANNEVGMELDTTNNKLVLKNESGAAGYFKIIRIA